MMRDNPLDDRDWDNVPDPAPTYDDLVDEFRIDLASDRWGETMSWLFDVAEELHWNRTGDAQLIPAEWEFRPGAINPFDGMRDDERNRSVAAAETDDLIRFGSLLDRYSRVLKRAGLDY